MKNSPFLLETIKVMSQFQTQIFFSQYAKLTINILENNCTFFQISQLFDTNHSNNIGYKYKNPFWLVDLIEEFDQNVQETINDNLYKLSLKGYGIDEYIKINSNTLEIKLKRRITVQNE